MMAPLPVLLATLSVAFMIPSSANAAVSSIIQLTSTEFYEMAMAGEFNVIIDTRTKLEWETGHIENATLMENLQNAQTSTAADIDSTTPDDAHAKIIKDYLNGCENCPIVVYCRSGSRAAQALELLQEIGFTGLLYNGLGVNQWTEAGYPLVINKPSLLPPCQNNNNKKTTTAAATTTNSLMGGAAAVYRYENTCEKSTLHGTYDTMAPLIQGGAVTISDDVNVIVNMPVGGGSVITQLTDPPKQGPTTTEQKPQETTSRSSSSSTTIKAFTTFLIGSSTLVMVNLVSAFVLG